MSYRIGIVAALPAELRPLVRGWVRQPGGAYLQQQGEFAALAIAGGMGVKNATRAVEQLASYGTLDALASIGWAGATSCGVQPGTTYDVGEVIDEASGTRYRTANEANSLKLVTSPRILGRQEKRSRAEQWGASLVDMEAAAVGRIAQEQGIPFYCWKAITDSANEELPDLNQFVVDHQLQLGQLLMYLVPRPRYIAPILRMGRNSRGGAAALARTVQRWLATIQSREAGTSQGNYADSHR